MVKKKEWIEVGESYYYFDNDEAQMAMVEKRVRDFLKRGMRVVIMLKTAKVDE